MVDVEDNNLLARVEDEAKTDEIVHIRVLAWQPLLHFEKEERQVAGAGVPFGLIVVVVVGSLNSGF